MLTLTKSRRNIKTCANAVWTKASHPPAVVERPRFRFFDCWMFITRLVAIGLLVAGLSFGIRQQYFSLSITRLFGAEVDADLKLALLGFVNKILDVLLLSSLEYMSSFLLTVWMSRASHAHGATFSDFELKEELTKPWMAIINFATRLQRSKWTWKSLLRCLLCLCISISVMLQGLAINTIAIPKKRWYPDPDNTYGLGLAARDHKDLTVEHPKTFLEAVDWLNLLGVGKSNVGEESYRPWDWALGLSASISFLGLTHVVSTIARTEKGWQQVYKYSLDGDVCKRWTAIHTNFSRPNRPIETISADDQQVTKVFDWLRQTHHQPTASSIGWNGNLTLVLPALSTVCWSANTSKLEGSINVTVPDSATSNNATFTIDIGPVRSLNFAGAACTTKFRQALYPVGFWIVDMQPPDLSLDGYGQWNQNIVYEPTISADHGIAHALAIQAHDTLPRLGDLVPSAGLLTQFLLMSRELQKRDSAIQSDTMGLSIVLGSLLQNLISSSNKYWAPLPLSLPPDPAAKITSYPLHWQLYGSGPRLAWEWVAVAVLIIVLLSFCVGLYQTLRYWMPPGVWVQLDGMMMIAQRSPPLEGIDDEMKAQKQVYWVEKDGGILTLRSKGG